LDQSVERQRQRTAPNAGQGQFERDLFRRFDDNVIGHSSIQRIGHYCLAKSDHDILLLTTDFLGLLSSTVLWWWQIVISS